MVGPTDIAQVKEQLFQQHVLNNHNPFFRRYLDPVLDSISDKDVEYYTAVYNSLRDNEELNAFQQDVWEQFRSLSSADDAFAKAAYIAGEYGRRKNEFLSPDLVQRKEHIIKKHPEIRDAVESFLNELKGQYSSFQEWANMYVSKLLSDDVFKPKYDDIVDNAIRKMQATKQSTTTKNKFLKCIFSLLLSTAAILPTTDPRYQGKIAEALLTTLPRPTPTTTATKPSSTTSTSTKDKITLSDFDIGSADSFLDRMKTTSDLERFIQDKIDIFIRKDPICKKLFQQYENSKSTTEKNEAKGEKIRNKLLQLWLLSGDNLDVFRMDADKLKVPRSFRNTKEEYNVRLLRQCLNILADLLYEDILANLDDDEDDEMEGIY